MSTLRADLLEQAVGAARAGQHSTARGLLQAILADNPADAQAWLWLSGVVDEPAEQVAALERVLEIEPSNVRASWGLQWMREHHPEIWLPPPAPIPPPTFPDEPPGDQEIVDDSSPVEGEPAEADGAGADLPVPPVEVTLSPVDEELRCPFCGAPATAEDLECPGCHRSLVVEEDRRRSRRICRLLLALMSLLVAGSAVGGSFWLLQAAQQISSSPTAVSAWRIGQATLIQPAQAVDLVSSSGLGLLGLALLGFVAMLGMLRRWRGMYLLDLLLTIGAIAGLVVLLLAGLNFFPSVLVLPVLLSTRDMLIFTALIGAGLMLMVLRLGLLAGARREFFPRRGRVRLSMQTLTAPEHFRLGGRYRDRGWYWAAARELELAVAEEPHKLKYRRLLAEAYGKLGDQARARDELRASVNLDPDTSPKARAGGLAKEVHRERQ
jgi:tetratricopeptide (TPR) repeat protein